MVTMVMVLGLVSVTAPWYRGDNGETGMSMSIQSIKDNNDDDEDDDVDK